MAEILVRRRIVPWGNGFGIRLSKREMERLGLHPRQEAEVVVRSRPRGAELDHITFLDLGHDASARHDDIIGEGL